MIFEHCVSAPSYELVDAGTTYRREHLYSEDLCGSNWD